MTRTNTRPLLGLFLAQGLKGRRIRDLSVTERLLVAEHLQVMGVISEPELKQAGESHLELVRLLRIHWLPYQSMFASLYPETDQTVTR